MSSSAGTWPSPALVLGTAGASSRPGCWPSGLCGLYPAFSSFDSFRPTSGDDCSAVVASRLPTFSILSASVLNHQLSTLMKTFTFKTAKSHFISRWASGVSCSASIRPASNISFQRPAVVKITISLLSLFFSIQHFYPLSSTQTCGYNSSRHDVKPRNT